MMDRKAQALELTDTIEIAMSQWLDEHPDVDRGLIISVLVAVLAHFISGIRDKDEAVRTFADVGKGLSDAINTANEISHGKGPTRQ